MASINFVDGSTVVPASWLNDVNTAVYFPTPPAAQTVTLDGDLTGTGSTGTSINTTLKTVNSNIGTFGSSTKVPQITTNAKGLITGVTELTLTSSTIGLGGQTISGNTTLTVNSSANIIVSSSTSAGKYITLPDATTCLQGISLFTISNNSKFDFGIKDSTGTKLGWIRSGITAMIGLNDKSTAAGVWSTINVEKIGVTAETNVTQTYDNYVQLDATRVLFYGGSSGNLYGVIYDYSSGLFGAETLILSSLFILSAALAVKNATNQVCFVGTTTTQHITIIVSCSGTTITPNTSVTSVFTNTPSQLNQFGIALVGTTVCYAYGETTGLSQFIRCISISGTTPTFRSPVTLSGNGSSTPRPIYLFATGSILRVVHAISGSASINVTPYTISGSTATIGTSSTITFGGFTGTRYSANQNSNGNIIIYAIYQTFFSACISVLSATTETVTEVTSGFASVVGSGSLLDEIVIYQISGNTFSTAFRATGETNLYTDTAGTLIKSTNSSAIIPVNAVPVSNTGNIVKYISPITSNRGTVVYVNYGVSPPVVSSSFAYFANSVTSFGFSNQSYPLRNLNPSTLVSASGEINSAGLLINTLFARQLNYPVDSGNSLTITGLSSNEGWASSGFASSNRLQRVEVAA